MTEKQLIDFTFPNLSSCSDFKSLFNRIIITPTNKKVDEINEIATNLIPGLLHEIKSRDTLIADSQQAKFPTEFLNSLSISGLPPHSLKLKIGQPIMLMRNINPAEGLCNGTRLTIIKIYTRLIEAEITIGDYAGTRVLIPRMSLVPSDSNLPFDFERCQFPIRPAFCMTINKSQGQTLDFISIWLGDDHVFTHGQLYVAMSRVSALENIKIASNNLNNLTRNVVFNMSG